MHRQPTRSTRTDTPFPDTARFRSRLERPDAVHGRIMDGTTPPGQILRDHLIALKESACGLSAAEIPETEVQEMAEVTVSLIAACLNGVGRAARGKPVAPLLPLSARIKRYIAKNLHDAMLTPEDRKSVVEGKSVSVRVDLGGRRIIKKKN